MKWLIITAIFLIYAKLTMHKSIGQVIEDLKGGNDDNF